MNGIASGESLFHGRGRRLVPNGRCPRERVEPVTGMRPPARMLSVRFGIRQVHFRPKADDRAGRELLPALCTDRQHARPAQTGNMAAELLGLRRSGLGQNVRVIVKLRFHGIYCQRHVGCVLSRGVLVLQAGRERQTH